MTATARVRLVIDMPLSGSWGNDCTIDQVYKQARESALEYIRATKQSVPKGLPLGTVVLESEVTAVFMAEKGDPK